MRVDSTALPGVLLLTPAVHRDARGSFHESWQQARYADAGLPDVWLQDNVSRSRKGVLRGLHFQQPTPQAKLVSAVAGVILDVAVDVRVGSPSFGRSVSIALAAGDAQQLYVPPGFAHGFLVLSDEAVVHYKCTAFYAPASERTLLWSDPALRIDWPTAAPILSPKDAAGQRLADFAEEQLPRYEAP